MDQQSKIYKIGNWWITDDDLTWYKEYRIRSARILFGLDPIPEIKEEETFYYVNLENSDDSVHTLGMKSRWTGKIYLTKDYEVDLTQPIENTDFHYVRDSTTFDL